MKNNIIGDINRYISYLEELGLYVTVHGKGISGLLEHNIHRNPFCSLVKTDNAAWDKCQVCQQRLYQEHSKGKLFGMCYAGLEEYVYFIGDKTFISVSGYAIDKERALPRINRLCDEFFIDKNELIKVYHHSLKKEKEDEIWLDTLLKPLCHMLFLLQILISDASESSTGNTMLDSIIGFVQRNFMQDISIKDIAKACACSESTVGHLFKEYTGQSAMKYINELRVKQAKQLLETSDLPIGMIAQMCGFQNINYFPTAFKKSVGVSPTAYRENIV